MDRVRPTPAEGFTLHGEAIPAALRTIKRSEAMGLTPSARTETYQDLEARVRLVLHDLASADIGSRYVHKLRDALGNPTSDTHQVAQDFKALFEVLGENPVPRQELKALLGIFDDKQLAELLAISPSSVQRYASGARETPEEVVDRIHYLALVTGYLTGTYNEYGVRRWFDRPRHQLDGKSPKQTLLDHENWRPDCLGAQKVEELAQALIGMPAT